MDTAKTARQTPSRKQWTALWTALLAVAALTAFTSNLAAPREHLALFLSTFAASAAILAAAAWRNRSLFLSPHLTRSRWIFFLILSAALLRLGALAAPVSLSDDVYRYAWDGQLILHGHNPYASTPAEFSQTDGFAAIATTFHDFDKLNSHNYHTVYPPLAQAVFVSGAALAKFLPLPAERAIRLLFALADLLTIALFARMLEKLGKNRTIALLYAWNPFIYWEFAAGGHSEALLLPWILLILLTACARTSNPETSPDHPIPLHFRITPGIFSGIALGLAALSKPTVLVIAPVLAVHLTRRNSLFSALSCAIVSAIILAGGYALLWHPDLLENHRTSFALYADTFSFNAPIFYTLQHHVWNYREGITPPVQHLIAPWLNFAIITIIALAALFQNGRTPARLATGFTLALAAHLLLSPVFHPWYMAPVLLCSFLASPGLYRPFLLLSLLVPLSYLFYNPDVSPSAHPYIMALQFIPFSLAALFSPTKNASKRAIYAILRRRAHTKYKAIAPHLQPGDRVLDIGAGEGFVSQFIARQGHETHLVERNAQSNRTELPITAYNGRDLPFSDAQFDVGILSYVLHHCEDPDQVLREAARVCRRLIILETVYITDFDRRRTTFLDHNANRLRGIPKEPLHFDTAEGWHRRFQAIGLKIQHFEWLGKGIHKHVIFVLDR